MLTVKRLIPCLAWAGVLVTGLGVFSGKAEAFYCRRKFIPFGYEPTGVNCSLPCESEWYVNGLSRVCIIYGPKLPD
jgi:hypothetical protein